MINQDMVRLPCARCGRTVLVPKEEYKEDPQGLITCDECWPIMQAEMWQGVETNGVVNADTPL